MKTKINGTILPTILGILAVLGLLVVFNLIIHNGDVFNSPDNGFFKIFVPIATVIALTTQFTLTLPFWNKFKSNKKSLGFDTFSIHCVTMYNIRTDFRISVLGTKLWN